MKISVTSRHGEIPETIQNSIRHKVSRLPRFFDRTTGIDVVVDLGNSQQPNVELVVSAEETENFFATDNGDNILSALDRVVQKIEKQLRKHKEKLTDHRVRGQRNQD